MTVPTRVLVENADIISPFITDIYNDSVLRSEFPTSLKLADVTPAHKKGDRVIEDHYRPVSILLLRLVYNGNVVSRYKIFDIG